MANKSSKSPSGEDREQGDHLRTEKVEKEDIKRNTGDSRSRNIRRGGQENLANRGHEEDHPHNPVRSSGSLQKEDQKAPAGEPEKNAE